MPTLRCRPATFLILLLCSACAPPGARMAERGQPRASQNVITRDQLDSHSFSNAYEAVESLRNNWLTPRGVDSFGSPSTVQVYFDNVRLGGVETLRAVTISSITYIQHFDGIAATERWGLDHGAGVIFISTRTVGR